MAALLARRPHENEVTFKDYMTIFGCTTKSSREDSMSWGFSCFLLIISLLDDYPKYFIVGAENVGSTQMEPNHILLHGKAVVLMDKNT